MSKRTSYRIELTDFESGVAVDALGSLASYIDPFGFDGSTVVSDSDYREALHDFCAGLRASARYYAHDREGRADFGTPEEADQYSDALARVADKIEAAIDAADEAAEKEAKEEEFQEWYEAELEREEELWKGAGKCPDTVN